MECGLTGLACKFIPRANGQTIITAINAIAHGGAKLLRYWAFMFDGQIGDAPARIQLIGSGKCICRAGIKALGAGTAMVYPTLLAVIGDVAHPTWRARSVGIYRLWRDAGFAVGALLAGVLADLISIEAAIYAVAALTAASGLVVLARMYETHPVSARS